MTTDTTTPAPSATKANAARLAAERAPLNLANRAARRRTWLHFLGAACPRHKATPGDPCWTIPSGVPGGTTVHAICGHRIEGRKLADRAARTHNR